MNRLPVSLSSALAMLFFAAVTAAEPSAQRVGDSPEPIATGVGSPSQEGDEAPTQQEEPSAQRVGESLRVEDLKLDGVIVTVPSGRSLALVRRPGARWSRQVRVGETVFGATVIEVGENWAVFEQDGRRSRLEVVRPGTARPALATVSVPRTTPENDTAPAPGSPEPRVVERDVLESRLQKEMSALLSETRILPRVVQGETRGYQITKLPQSSVLSDLGLEPGDVVVSINGQVVDGLPFLISLYPSFLNAPDLVVELEREGRLLTLGFRFR